MTETVVITGASAGIGLAIARRFVDEGAFAYITGRNRPALEDAAKDIGGAVAAVPGNAALLADLDRLYATVKAEKGAVDIVVANAGFRPCISQVLETESGFIIMGSLFGIANIKFNIIGTV